MAEAVADPAVDEGEDDIDDAVHAGHRADGGQIDDLASEHVLQEHLLVAVVEEEAQQEQHARRDGRVQHRSNLAQNAARRRSGGVLAGIVLFFDGFFVVCGGFSGRLGVGRQDDHFAGRREDDLLEEAEGNHGEAGHAAEEDEEDGGAAVPTAVDIRRNAQQVDEDAGDNATQRLRVRNNGEMGNTLPNM